MTTHKDDLTANHLVKLCGHIIEFPDERQKSSVRIACTSFLTGSLAHFLRELVELIFCSRGIRSIFHVQVRRRRRQHFFGFLNSCDTKHGKEGHATRRPKVHLLSLLKVDIDHH